MKNNSNIYDINGEIVRRFEDTRRFTALEATNIQKKYLKKAEDLRNKDSLTEEENKKLKIYEIYCKNLQHYIYVELSNMNKSELEEYYKAISPEKPKETTEEQIKKAIEELKNDTNSLEEDKEVNVDDKESDMDEEPENISKNKTLTQDDLLVERDNVTTVMDEYVDFVEDE